MTSEVLISESRLHEAIVLALRNDLGAVSKQLVMEDAPNCLRASVTTVKQIGRYTRSLYNTARDNGIANSFKMVGEDSKGFGIKVIRIPSTIKQIGSSGYKEFKKQINDCENDIEKAELILKLSCYLSSTVVGGYIGYNLPDKDISYKDLPICEATYK